MCEGLTLDSLNSKGQQGPRSHRLWLWLYFSWITLLFLIGIQEGGRGVPEMLEMLTPSLIRCVFFCSQFFKFKLMVDFGHASQPQATHHGMNNQESRIKGQESRRIFGWCRECRPTFTYFTQFPPSYPGERRTKLLYSVFFFRF